LHWNHQQKCRFLTGINCFIRLTEFVKENAAGDYKSRAAFVRRYATDTAAPNILRKHMKFESYTHTYRLLCNVPAQDKEARYRSIQFLYDFFQDFKKTICLQTELSSAMIQPSIYRKILIDITLEFEGATVLSKELNTRETVKN
jgi:hypothetical protein